MAVLLGAFLFNLLCSIVPCDPDFGSPEILDTATSRARREHGLDPPIVNTNLGPVEGYFTKSTQGRLIYTFEGIPYAEPPINEFRFRPALKKRAWDAVLMAKRISPFCLQLHASKLFRVIGQEDCLYLNIYTPEIPVGAGKGGTSKDAASENLPVIVWIHGGSFIFGSGGEYGAAMMLDENVLLVTINYRLGVLGFLSTGDENCPGNYGLHDQSVAIEWVHENIHHFGGNPRKITLMGQSAGGVSVHLNMMSSTVSKKYVHAAVSLSGNAFDPWALKTGAEGRRLAARMGEHFNCPSEGEDTASLVQCLRQVNPVFLVAKQLSLFDWLPFPVVLFSPVLERESPGAFITATADEAYRMEKVSRIPWITTVTAQEGYTALLLTEPLKRTAIIRSRWAQLAPLVLAYKDKFRDSVTGEITGRITQFYFGDRDMSPSNASLDALSEIISDRYFNVGFHHGLQRHAQIGPTFGYIFGYKGEYGLEGGFGIPPTQWGVGHAEDVFYYFNSSATFPGFRLEGPEKEMSKIMINLIVNFADSRVPFYTDKKGKEKRIWKRIDDVQNLKVLELNSTITMISEPFKNRIQFWESLNEFDSMEV